MYVLCLPAAERLMFKIRNFASFCLISTILVQIKQFVLFALQEALVSIKKAPLHVHKELILKKASSIARSVKPD